LQQSHEKLQRTATYDVYLPSNQRLLPIDAWLGPNKTTACRQSSISALGPLENKFKTDGKLINLIPERSVGSFVTDDACPYSKDVECHSHTQPLVGRTSKIQYFAEHSFFFGFERQLNKNDMCKTEKLLNEINIIKTTEKNG
jgi:hypothetical protein